MNDSKTFKTIKISSSPETEISDEKIITIPLAEYKELLITKGKYEELKSQQTIPWTINPTGATISYYDNTGKKIENPEPPYKVTCK